MTPPIRTQRHATIMGVTALMGMIASAQAQIPPLNTHVVSNWDGHPADYIAADLWADDKGFAYVCNRFGPSIDIMDISDPTSPTLAVTYEIGPPNQFTNAKEVKVGDGLMFIGLDDDSNDGIEIVDVRDPRRPQRLVNVRIPGYPDVHKISYDHGYLYFADSRTNSFVVMDFTQFDPDNPPAQTITQAKWIIQNVGASFVHDVTAVEGRLYVSAWNSGVWIYDIRDIANQPPIFLASAPGQSTHAAWPTRDQRWIVTNEERSNGGGVKLYELTKTTDAYSLSLQFTYTIPLTDAQSSHNVYFVGYRVYCAWYNRGLMAFDLDPIAKRLNLVAHYDTSVNTVVFHGAWGVYPFLGRDKVLLADKETQFWIFDVRIPASGDWNGDADVDLPDFAGLQTCFTGPDAAYTDQACEIFDFNNDQRIDSSDYAAFSASQTGPR